MQPKPIQPHRIALWGALILGLWGAFQGITSPNAGTTEYAIGSTLGAAASGAVLGYVVGLIARWATK